MKTIGHRMIMASAGSGKTYALTNRYLRLLTHGARPERIAALTFTRRAAGEFFDEILRKLARAASDEAYAKEIAAEIEAPGANSAEFGRLLRAVITAMPRLNLGTLDGFLARIVRAFPLELGLGGDFEILEAHAARMERRRVLRRMFARSGGALEAAQVDFVEAFKRATFGVEEKRLGARLDSLLDDHAEIYLEATDVTAWGQAGRIWPQGSLWPAAASRIKLAQALSDALPWEGLSPGQKSRWEGFFAALPGWSPGAVLPEPVEYLFRNAFKAWPNLAVIVVDRKTMALAPAAAAALKRLLEGLVGAELNRRLEMTRGIFAVLREYEKVYDGLVRRKGRLSFADLQRLLRPEAGGPVLSRQARDETRLFIDWRIDAQIDHWLLDEFQDTSFSQWSVLRNLIDEAVQDPEGTRSLFYVGDVKQAIFAWRGGDVRLFREIFNRYNSAAPGLIGEGKLMRSYRSGPAVVSMVNRVFEKIGSLRSLFPAEAVDRWESEWGEHTSENQAVSGYAELRQAGNETARFAETLRILEEVRPLSRGLETAVLVRTNSTATALADFLRRQGRLPAVAESDLNVGIDNPLTCALLSLYRAAAHPGDRAARLHLRMTPLAALLAEEGLTTDDALTTRILEEIHAGGFENSSEAWLRRLEPLLAMDDSFSRERGRQFVAAARAFDDTGRREVAEFVQFISHYTLRETDAAGIVRVMTVHKAKGLGFDLVILPDLEGQTLAERRSGLAMQKTPDRAVNWILHLPSRDFFAHDPVLAGYAAGAEADACYENFCLLYVAMTRAKKALYVITQPVGNSKSPNFPRLLRDTLGETWASGDARWFECIEMTVVGGAPAASPLLESGRAQPRPRRRPRRPSAEKAGLIGASRLFLPEASASKEMGVAVHALLAEVEWAEADQAARITAVWDGRGRAGEEAAACLLAPELAGVWRRPASEAAEAWRERRFEVVLGEAWVSGTFDRVVVSRGPDGRALAATVFDFKTDRRDDLDELEAAAAQHAGQMNLYRRAVANLAGLDIAAVSAEIVFTHLRRRVVCNFG